MTALLTYITGIVGIVGSIFAAVTVGNEAAWVGIGLTIIALYGSSIWLVAGMKSDIKRTADAITEIKNTNKEQWETLNEHGGQLIQIRTKM